MVARWLCRATQLPSKALFYFPEEDTGISSTHFIIEKNAVTVGDTVTGHWQGEHVPAEIIKLSGKYSCSKCYMFCTYQIILLNLCWLAIFFSFVGHSMCYINSRIFSAEKTILICRVCLDWLTDKKTYWTCTILYKKSEFWSLQINFITAWALANSFHWSPYTIIIGK